MRESQQTTRRFVRDHYMGIVPWRHFHLVFMHHVRNDMRHMRRRHVENSEMLRAFAHKHTLSHHDVFDAAEPNDIEASSDIMRVTGLRCGRTEGAVV